MTSAGGKRVTLGRLPSHNGECPAPFRSVLVYRDGSVEVDFRDNSGLAVDPSGCCFASSSPAGVVAKKFTSFATSAHRRQLSTAFHWRNRCTEPVVYSRRRLLDDWRQSMVAAAPIRSTSMP